MSKYQYFLRQSLFDNTIRKLFHLWNIQKHLNIIFGIYLTSLKSSFSEVHFLNIIYKAIFLRKLEVKFISLKTLFSGLHICHISGKHFNFSGLHFINIIYKAIFLRKFEIKFISLKSLANICHIFGKNLNLDIT